MPSQRTHSCTTHSLYQLTQGPYPIVTWKLETVTNTPEIHYTPTTDMTRVFRDVLKYVHKNNEYGEGSLLNKSNFSTLFPFLYFDLTKQKMDIKDGTTKLTFKYELSGTTATAYSIYALTRYEQDIELIQTDGKIILRSSIMSRILYTSNDKILFLWSVTQ